MFPSQVKHAEAEPPRFTLSPPLKELLSDDAAAEQPRFVERVTEIQQIFLLSLWYGSGHPRVPAIGQRKHQVMHQRATGVRLRS